MTTSYEVARDFVEVRGPEAATYLQGQLSQDVETLAVGAAAFSFVLQPTGKVDAWVRVLRLGDDHFVVDVDGGWGEGLTARLQRFLLRTKADITPLDWACIALRRGPDDAELPLVPGDEVPDGWAVTSGWPESAPGGSGVDLVGPGVSVPSGVPDGSQGAYEAARVVAGVPAMGSELTEKTIPAEVGQGVIDRSVSFTKGCFTGQELVARVDSRGGNVPRRLRAVVATDASGDAAIPSGAVVEVDGAEVGVVTSTARSATYGSVALAFVKRAVEPPAAAVARAASGEVPVTVRSVPLEAGM